MNYLERLAMKATGAVYDVQPRVRARFESAADGGRDGKRRIRIGEIAAEVRGRTIAGGSAHIRGPDDPASNAGPSGA